MAYQSVHAPLQVPSKYMDQYSHIQDMQRRTYAGNIIFHCAGFEIPVLEWQWNE